MYPSAIDPAPYVVTAVGSNLPESALMGVPHFDLSLRDAAMEFVVSQPGDTVSSDVVQEFVFNGRRVPLMDRQRGIRKPAILAAALSIRTTYTPPGKTPPYLDVEGPDGLLRYMYRGTDPEHHENVALRAAMTQELPLIWFFGIAPGRYLARCPVWIVAEERGLHRFAVAVDEGQRFVTPGAALPDAQRRYVETLTHRRLHQPLFRARVLSAYSERCALCMLRHPRLLDAAHIIADGKPGGEPVVPNGLAMCKIHHAAFDENILGVSPDLRIKVRDDILAEVDGPMLKHGLQELDGQAVRVVPRARDARPNRDKLAERFEDFLAAS